jgi:hypothetical protein
MKHVDLNLTAEEADKVRTQFNATIDALIFLPGGPSSREEFWRTFPKVKRALDALPDERALKLVAVEWRLGIKALVDRIRGAKT